MRLSFQTGCSSLHSPPCHITRHSRCSRPCRIRHCHWLRRCPVRVSAVLFHVVISSFFSPFHQFFGVSASCFSQNSCLPCKIFAVFYSSSLSFLTTGAFCCG